MPDGTTVIRPEHSPLGASSAERWMKCPGSVALAKALGPREDGDADYRVEGQTAHSLAAYCLERGLDAWEAMGEFPVADMEMASAVQVYLDYCRSRTPKRRMIEHPVEHPAFHPQMYGRLDCVDIDPEPGVALEMMDYKHGVGVLVDVEGNVQERYYVFALISGQKWPADLDRLEDMARIKLTIVQPRGFHPDGPIRSWMVTAGEVRNWAYNELHPAMERAGELDFKMGEHCRFCPAKDALVCPEQRKLASDAALVGNELTKPLDQFNLADVDDEWLGAWYARLSLLDMFKKAIRDETDRRCKAGKTVPGAKLVFAKVDRAWKPDAVAIVDPDFPDDVQPGRLEQLFGAEAWEPRKLRSPASIEGIPGGKEFCAEWASKPKAGLTVAPLSDKRTAQTPLTNEEVFSAVETT